MTPRQRFICDTRRLLASLVLSEPKIQPSQQREIGRLLNFASPFLRSHTKRAKKTARR